MKLKLLFSTILLFLLGLIVISWHYRLNPLESFSLQFNDVNFDLQKKVPNQNIVFVAVDEPSVNKFGRWPWKRSIVAQGIEKLHEADVVLMDMIFSEPTNQQDDTTLATALSDVNSVCGFFLRHKATQTITPEQENILSDSSLDLLQMQSQKAKNPLFIATDHAEMNILKVLEACSMSATFSTFRAKDQLLRKYPTAYYYRNYLYPSLGVQALRIYKNKDIQRVGKNSLAIDNRKIITDDNGFVRLNFYQKNLYNTISFLDLVEGRVNPKYFKNKIVILGITDVGAADVRATPMGAMNGPLLHYTFISNYLNNELIIEKPYYTLALMLLVFIITFALFYTLNSITKRVSGYIVSYLILYGAVRALFVSENIYIDLFYPLLVLIVSAILFEIYAFITKEDEGKFIKDTFSSYLSGELLNKLIQNPQALQLGGEEKEMSILFSDIRSFTSISEKMTPHDLITLMNRYFTPMTQSVMDHGGMLDKYIGDAVMAFYNAPVSIENHAEAACDTALEMMQKLAELDKEFEKEGLPFIDIGIGINTAKVVVGNMGSTHRFNYTVLGDGVNLASRVEGTNKQYHTNILITEFTKAQISQKYLTRRLEPVKVKGKDESVLLYELMQNTQKNRELKDKFELAIVLYEEEQYHDAMVAFETLYNTYKDKVSMVFYEKSKERT